MLGNGLKGLRSKGPSKRVQTDPALVVCRSRRYDKTEKKLCISWKVCLAI